MFVFVCENIILGSDIVFFQRWTELPGEPPIIDDSDVDDWIQRFVVFHGSCIFYYFQSTDLSPQDTTLISDVVEVGSLPSFPQKDLETRFAFYILTSPGLRFECSSLSKPQVCFSLFQISRTFKFSSTISIVSDLYRWMLGLQYCRLLVNLDRGEKHPQTEEILQFMDK